jgi:hypothetical protein
MNQSVPNMTGAPTPLTGAELLYILPFTGAHFNDGKITSQTLAKQLPALALNVNTSPLTDGVALNVSVAYPVPPIMIFQYLLCTANDANSGLNVGAVLPTCFIFDTVDTGLPFASFWTPGSGGKMNFVSSSDNASSFSFNNGGGSVVNFSSMTNFSLVTYWL